MKYIKIVNWEEYQHYKDRNPPWIKLYTHLLDSYLWTCLSDSAKLLHVLLFILAARTNNNIPFDKKWIRGKTNVNGKLPIAELLDITDDTGNPKYIYIFDDASDMLAGCKQDAITRREEERQRQRRGEGDGITHEFSKKEWRELFENFNEAYPASKRNKGLARTSWMRLPRTKALYDKIMLSLEKHKRWNQWTKDNGDFIPGAAVFLNQERWEDDPEAKPKPAPKPEPSNGQNSLELESIDLIARWQPLEEKHIQHMGWDAARVEDYNAERQHRRPDSEGGKR
jgi:hypothetical protein